LPRSPVIGNISFRHLEPTDSDDCFNAVRIVSGAGQKPALDTLGDDASYVGCSFGLYEMSVEMDQEPITPRFSGLAAVQMGNSLDFVAVSAEIRRGAASSFAYADGQPIVSKFDYECSGVARESCTG
jgi:hypothetical protein